MSNLHTFEAGLSGHGRFLSIPAQILYFAVMFAVLKMMGEMGAMPQCWQQTSRSRACS
jgi:hypothetical protein